MKGILIILVVMHHAGAPVTKWICMFHMATFFMVSGYLFDDKNADSLRNVLTYGKRKVKSLYLPYIIFNGAAIVMNNFFIRIGFYTTDRAFLTIGGVNAVKFGLASVFSAADVLKAFIKTLLFFGGSQVGGATWFLRALFIASLAHCLAVFAAKKLSIDKGIMLLLETGLCGACLQGFMNAPLPHRELILQAIASYLAFLFGVIVRRVSPRFRAIAGHPALRCLASAALIEGMTFAGSVSVSAGNVTNVVLYSCASLAGWGFTESLALMLERLKKTGAMLSYCGRHSLYIVLWHFICMKMVTFVYIVMSGKDRLLLASHPVLDGGAAWLWIAYSIVGVCAPLLIGHLYEKGRRLVGAALS